MDIKKYIYIHVTRDDEQEIIDSVIKGVAFRGFNFWVLVFAIFVASLGLNVNSTAVIIGAMLISPLMGPIIGMGLAVGISDFDLLKRALKNYGISAFVSVITATIYFLLSPINDAQSELLARTEPTFYDVLIAFFGGMAGVVAICARERGNVIPGVAIATALMPPLCTAGYGLAQGEWMYFLGALYLFFINTVFISLATYLGVRLFRFHRHTYMDEKRGKQLNHYITAIVLITIIPAILTTIRLVRTSIYENNVNRFVKAELSFDGTQIIQRSISYDTNTVKIVMVGRQIPEETLDSARMLLSYYHLSETKLSIIQGMTNDSINLRSNNSYSLNQIIADEEQTIKRLNSEISQLNQELSIYRSYNQLSAQLTPELHALFPAIQSVAISQAVRTHVNDTIPADTLCIIQLDNLKQLNQADCKKISEWLKARIQNDNILLVE